MSLSSLVAWRGPSLFTGDEIQMSVTGLAADSKNDKTGAMVQTIIASPHHRSVAAYGTDLERAYCGDCIMRGARVNGKLKNRACYVRWAAFLNDQHKSKYPLVSLVEARAALRGKDVRLGAFGDPAAMPFDVVNELIAGARMWTGYTHAWRDCDQRWRFMVMASVETLDGYLEANRRGWRTFRTKLPSMPVYPSEIRCPAETHGITCQKCGLCSGKSKPAKNICINAHGPGAAHFVTLTHPRLTARMS
jgi:hypothetical protein